MRWHGVARIDMAKGQGNREAYFWVGFQVLTDASIVFRGVI
jgi:hypothetical protein